MRFIFYSSSTFEPWDWTNPVEKGIGGSETHHIELARRLAVRGHEVWSYAPVPWSGVRFQHTDEAPDTPRCLSVRWEHCDNANFELPGVWIWARDVEGLDKIPHHHEQRIWFVAQDSFYTTWQEERIRKCDRIMALCQAQRANMLAREPVMRSEQVIVSSNGIPSDALGDLKALPKRNPRRLIYTSSPDRGLKQLLMIFARVREYLPDVELHCFYGFDNIDKIIENMPVTGFIRNKEEILTLLRQPGVHWHGRIGQRELWRQWLQSGIWAYPANFTETSCISCMEAQALGTIPVCNPIWAVGENVKHGVFLDGEVNDPLTQARYAAEIVRLASQPQMQEQIRAGMMPWARKQFDWERIVDQFEALAAVAPLTQERIDECGVQQEVCA